MPLCESSFALNYTPEQKPIHIIVAGHIGKRDYVFIRSNIVKGKVSSDFCFYTKLTTIQKHPKTFEKFFENLLSDLHDCTGESIANLQDMNYEQLMLCAYHLMKDDAQKLEDL